MSTSRRRCAADAITRARRRDRAGGARGRRAAAKHQWSSSCRAAATCFDPRWPIRSSPASPVRGVVIASEYLTSGFAARARRMTAAYEDYQQLQVLKQPLAGVYLSFFLMLTLMILIGSTWMGLYLAKRITRPIQLLATAAREIGAGHLDHRVVPRDAGRVRVAHRGVQQHGGRAGGEPPAARAIGRRARTQAPRRRRAEAIRRDDSRSHCHRRGLRRCARPHQHRELAPPRGCLASTRRSPGSPRARRSATRELQPLADVIDEALRSTRRHPPARRVADARRARTAPCDHGDAAAPARTAAPTASCIVFDDVTPLIRAQKVAAWREVARRLAHEIKNPLTPIQLSAERIRRHLSSAP